MLDLLPNRLQWALVHTILEAIRLISLTPATRFLFKYVDESAQEAKRSESLLVVPFTPVQQGLLFWDQTNLTGIYVNFKLWMNLILSFASPTIVETMHATQYSSLNLINLITQVYGRFGEIVHIQTPSHRTKILVHALPHQSQPRSHISTLLKLFSHLIISFRAMHFHFRYFEYLVI